MGEFSLEKLSFGSEKEGGSPFSCTCTKVKVQEKPDVLLWNMMVKIIFVLVLYNFQKNTFTIVLF